MVLHALQWQRPHSRAPCKRRHWRSAGLLLLVALHFGAAWLGTRLPLASRAVGCAAQGSATVESTLAQDVAGILGTLGASSAATDKVQEWCHEQGAASFTELLENADSLIQAADLDPAPAAVLRRSLCAKASAEGSLLPQMAFVHSPALKPAVQRIADLLAEEGGNQKFNKLVDVVLEQLAVGRLDWQQISSSIPSLAADAPAAEVALQLLTLGNNLAEEVNVTSSNGRSVSGLLRGSVVSLRFGRSPADQNWGQWASFFVEDGPALLLGHRLVAGKRSSGDPLFDQATGEPSLQADDTLYFAMPDRAALLELATYDQLPEFATQLAGLLKEGADESTGVIAPPDMVSAAKFVNEIDGLSDLEKAERRFRRFESSQPVQRLASAMDTPWTPVLEAAAPRMNELYQAVRKAMLAARPATSVQPRRVSVIRISLAGAVGLLIILGALIFGIWQFLKPASEVGQTENLPLYTLQSSEAPASTK